MERPESESARLREIPIRGGSETGRRVEDGYTEWEVDLASLLRFLRSHAVGGVVGAVGLAVVTLLVVLFLVPDSYKSTATLAILPPTVKSELVPGVLSVQAYQRLLESPGVVAEAVARLRETEVIEEDERLEVGKELRTLIFVSRREETTSLAPLLEAQVFFDTPEGAAEIANVWTAVFLESARRLFLETTGESTRLIESLYPANTEELIGREEAWRVAADEYERRQTELLAAWDRDVARTRRKTTEDLAEFEASTRDLMLEELARWLRTVADGSPPLLAGVSVDLRGAGRHLVLVRSRLAHARPVVTLKKAISDESLWQSLFLEGTGSNDVEVLRDTPLLTEEFDPEFETLSLQALDAERALVGTAAEHGIDATDLTVALEGIQRDRSVGYKKLREDRKVIETNLLRKRAEAIEQLERERNTRLAVLRREINQLKDLEAKLTSRFNEAVIANAQDEFANVRLAVAAVVAEEPESKHLVVLVLLAVLLGLAFGIGASSFLAVGRSSAAI